MPVYTVHFPARLGKKSPGLKRRFFLPWLLNHVIDLFRNDCLSPMTRTTPPVRPMKYHPVFLTAIAGFASASLLLTPAQADPVSAVTDPVGVVTVDIQPSSNGSSFAITPFSAPLHGEFLQQGISAGRISAVSENTITVSNANWMVNSLAQTGSPYFIKILTGAAAGSVFQISENTAESVTIRRTGVDTSISLVTLGVTGGQNGDRFEIFPGDTLLSLLGTPSDGVVGGSTTQFSNNLTDRVLINDPANNSAFTYYFDTTHNQWRRPLSSANQGNLVISPRMGLTYFRIGTEELNLSFVGRVSPTGTQGRVARNGVTILSPYSPVDRTLNQLMLHELPGWKRVGQNGVTATDADRVVLKVGTNLFSYHYDHTLSQWRRPLSSANQNSVLIPAASAVRVVRTGLPGEFDQHVINFSLQ